MRSFYKIILLTVIASALGYVEITLGEHIWSASLRLAEFPCVLGHVGLAIAEDLKPRLRGLRLAVSAIRMPRTC
jgi:hypothetical protein